MRLFIAIVLFSFAFSGCRIMPVQMARVTQIDTYEHWYEFKDEAHADKVFRIIMGQKNWESFIQYCGRIGEVLQDLQRREIQVQGTIIMTLSLVPTDHEKFIIEGFGQYYVVRKTTNEIMFSATYYILDNIHSLKELQTTNCIEVETKQYLIRHFAAEKPHYFHDTPLRFRFYTRLLQDRVYTLDYDRKHELVIGNEAVGYLQFHRSRYGDKVIDMRGISYLKNDYKTQ